MWIDKLITCNGSAFVYDPIGNPLLYNNGKSYDFTWEKGRQLKSAVSGGIRSTYAYDRDGIRTEKHTGSADYNYRMNGTQIVEMEKDSLGDNQRLVFTYDESGRPYSIDCYVNMSETPTKYYYITNLN